MACSVKDSQAALPKYVLINWVCTGGLGRGAEGPRTVLLQPSPLTDAVGRELQASACPQLLSFPYISFAVTLQVGEDVPDARKCACASHVAKVAEFFQVRVGSGLAGLATGNGDWLPEPAFFLRQGVDVIVNASSVRTSAAGAIGQRLSSGWRVLQPCAAPTTGSVRTRMQSRWSVCTSGGLALPGAPLASPLSVLSVLWGGQGCSPALGLWAALTPGP